MSDEVSFLTFETRTLRRTLDVVENGLYYGPSKIVLLASLIEKLVLCDARLEAAAANDAE